VDRFSRNFNNKEKEVDGALIVDVTETACMENGGTIVILTGDRDPLPAIRKELERGCIVEVWSFEHSLRDKNRIT